MNCIDQISGTMLIMREGSLFSVKSIKSASSPDPENSPVIGIPADGVESISAQTIPGERPTRSVKLIEASPKRCKPEHARHIYMDI